MGAHTKCDCTCGQAHVFGQRLAVAVESLRRIAEILDDAHARSALVLYEELAEDLAVVDHSQNAALVEEPLVEVGFELGDGFVRCFHSAPPSVSLNAI